ncbi:hypothetical protein E2C01_036765 [Portunus trituberculatus]|uniref:Uncharacterized protein n=1 Tax=Portunus trituberculatus TaxID=210409 RepID=A0A5B7FDJ6_PORTR|nr:hypothetical protein [Portunus trituberculatus]
MIYVWLVTPWKLQLCHQGFCRCRDDVAQHNATFTSTILRKGRSEESSRGETTQTQTLVQKQELH